MDPKNIDILIPSYNSKELTLLAVKSFEKYKSDFNFRYIIVENAGNDSYKEDVLSVSENVKWISRIQSSGYLRASANAEAIEEGLREVESDLVFICHNDVVACHPEWMSYLYSKIQEGNVIAGTVLDNVRIEAVHISGLLIKSEIAKKVSCYPILEESSPALSGLSEKKLKEIKQTRKSLNIPDDAKLDVGDTYTKYCRENGLNCFCCRNVENNNINPKELKEPFQNFQVDRAVNDHGEVIYMHLGRGIAKQDGNYYKKNRIFVPEWKAFIETNIL